MKQKNSLLFSIIFVCFLKLLTSCEAEKNFTKDNKIIIKKCTMKDLNLSSDIKLNEAANYLKKLQTKNLKDNSNAKLVYDEKSGLYLDDEKGIYLSSEGKESYTFPVISSNITEKIKNITFNKNNNNEYDIYIVMYDFTKEDLNNYTKEVLAERDINFQALLKNGIEYPVEAQWFICFYTEALTEAPIDHGDLTGNFGHEFTWVTISSACFSGTDISGGSSSSSANSNEGDNNDSGAGGVLTSAVVDNEAVLPTVTDNPCKALADLSLPNSGDIKPEIDMLKTKLNETVEFGVEVEKSPYPNTDGTYNYPKTEKESDESNHVEISTGGFIIGAAHSHPANITYAIPSYGDLKWLEICVSNVPPIRQKHVFTMIVCKDAFGTVSVYGIKIKDILSFRSKVNAIWDSAKYSGKSVEQKQDEISKLEQIEYSKTNGQNNQLEKKFLEMFAGFGFDVLKATNDNLDNWTKLELDSSQPSGVKSVPCINN